MRSWFPGAAAAAPPPSRMEKHFLVNENNETPYGYFLHRRTGQHSRTGFFYTPPDEIDKLETFKGEEEHWERGLVRACCTAGGRDDVVYWYLIQ